MNLFREGPAGPGSLRPRDEISSLRTFGAPVEMTLGESASRVRRGSRGRTLPGMALLAAALLLAVAVACAMPAASAFADGGGEVQLGINVEAIGAGVGQGGSVELGAKVAAKGRPASGANEVELAINMKAASIHQVSFVGYYCDESGNVIEEEGSPQRETIEVQDVRHGGHAAAPANLARTYDAGGGAQAECWVDGWYAYGAGGALQKVDLATYEVTGGTTLVCYWKRGYVVRLDPNNGADSTGAPVFDGAVAGASSGYVAVPRDAAFEEGNTTGDPGGYAAPELPEATRAGYRFAGWYWADPTGIKDAHGRAILKDIDGDPVAAADAELPYDFFREHCADGASPTLYAKWEIPNEARVRIHLADARRSGVADVDVWFWQGRGYALERPEADKEVTPGFVITSKDEAPDPLDLGIDQNPTPPSSTQYFAGWGYQVSDVTPMELRYLITCVRQPADADSTKAAYTYAFGDWMFNRDYLDADSMTWTAATDADDATGAPSGQRLVTWAALFKTAKINVSAPFRVTFTKERGTDPAAHEPYMADDLTWTGDKTEPWVMSAEQPFTNSGDTDVYVSRIECVDAGAAALFPEGAKGIRVFSLGTSQATPESGQAIFFGYAGEGKDVSVGAADPTKWIVLKNASGANRTLLYFGLNIHDAGFNRDGVILGDDENASYTAGLANVKYTYSVVN